MRLCAAGWVGLVLAVSLGCVPAPVLWSPEGRWLAYTTAVRSEEQRFAPGWLFRLDPGPEGEQLGWKISPDRPATLVYRLWTMRSDTGDSVLLEESQNPLTSPVWRADGKAIAFGRLTTESDGRHRFEVLVQDSPDGKRVVSKQSEVETSLRPDDLPGLTLAWSSDGRYLAIPLLQQTLGIAIIRVDDGRVLKQVADASLPAWSPDGTKLAFLRGSDDMQSLHYLDTNFGPPRHLADVGRACQPPVWSRDKHSIMVVTRRKVRKLRVAEEIVTALVRVSLDGGAPTDDLLPIDPHEGKPRELGTSFAFDPEAESLFFSDDIEGDQSIISWFLPRTKEVRKRENPIDPMIRVSSFALAPGAKSLAFRAGGPAYFTPPGLWDFSGNRFTPLIPDDSARLEWIATLVASARQLLRGELPPVVGGNGQPVERPTILPIPGELAEKPDTSRRLRNLGRLGKALCDRHFVSTEQTTAVVRDQVDEARLFFNYLCDDFNGALGILEDIEARAPSADHRLRLISLRVQICAGMGQDERVERTLEFLQSLERKNTRRWEVTPAGPTLTVEDAPGSGWAEYLALRSQDWAKTAGKRAGGASIDSFGPQAGDPRGFEALPFAPDNALEQRQDDVPAVINNPGNNGNMPRLVPVPVRPGPLPAQNKRRGRRPPF